MTETNQAESSRVELNVLQTDLLRQDQDQPSSQASSHRRDGPEEERKNRPGRRRRKAVHVVAPMRKASHAWTSH